MPSIRSLPLGALVVGALTTSLVACTDDAGLVAPSEDTVASDPAETSPTQWRGVGAPSAFLLFGRYPSIGTSVSMGWQSDGAVAAPIASGLRTSGEAAAAPTATLACAPNKP